MMLLLPFLVLISGITTVTVHPVGGAAVPAIPATAHKNGFLELKNSKDPSAPTNSKTDMGSGRNQQRRRGRGSFAFVAVVSGLDCGDGDENGVFEDEYPDDDDKDDELEHIEKYGDETSNSSRQYDPVPVSIPTKYPATSIPRNRQFQATTRKPSPSNRILTILRNLIHLDHQHQSPRSNKGRYRITPQQRRRSGIEKTHSPLDTSNDLENSPERTTPLPPSSSSSSFPQLPSSGLLFTAMVVFCIIGIVRGLSRGRSATRRGKDLESSK